MIMQDIKISIVIPIYNVAPYVEECIQSVMNQTWKGKLECILVDDCGTDDSMKVATEKLKGYNGKIDFKVICHERNRGLSAARNSGIDAVTGDYVYFLDSDDEITADCIEQLAKPLEKSRYDFVVADYTIVGSDMSKAPLLLKDGTTLNGREVLRAYRKSEWYMLSVNKLYQVAFLNQYNLRFFEGIIHEDELWSFQIACLAQSLYSVGYVTYIYKIRKGSITVNQNHERRCFCINVILKEMCVFSSLHQMSHNKEVHNLIQNFQMITLNSIHSEAPDLLQSFYLEQRHGMNTKWLHCFLLNSINIRRQLRDLHLLLPVSAAVSYLKLLFRFL